MDNPYIHYDAAARYMERKEREREILIQKLYAAWISESTPILIEVGEYPSRRLLGLACWELGGKDIVLSPADIGEEEWRS